MSIKNSNQKGFAALEAILVIVIIAIVGGTAYYVYRASNKSTDTQNAAHTSVESASQSATTTKSATAAGVQAKKIYGDLLKAYKKDGATKSNWDVTYVDSTAAKSQFTSDFKKAVDNGSAWAGAGPFCTANYNFESFLVDKATLSGDTANVTLALTVKGKKSTDYPTPIQLTLQYADGKWAISQHECGA